MARIIRSSGENTKTRAMEIFMGYGFISIFYQSMNEIFYCSVMECGGMHKAIAIYQGVQIQGFLELARNQIPEYTLLNYQECLMYNY